MGEDFQLQTRLDFFRLKGGLGEAPTSDFTFAFGGLAAHAFIHMDMAAAAAALLLAVDASNRAFRLRDRFLLQIAAPMLLARPIAGECPTLTAFSRPRCELVQYSTVPAWCRLLTISA